jgi:hypothetical protein
MSVLKKYTLHSVTIGSSAINQCKMISINPSITRMLEFGSGTVDPTFTAIDSEEPVCRFSSTALKKVLAAVDLNNGVVISSTAKAYFYFQQMAPGGTRLAGSTAFRIGVTVGIGVVNTIEAANGPATADVSVFACSSDGETSPLDYTANVAVPSLAATDQMYTIGPVKVNGAFVGGIESIRFDPRVNVRRNRGDGEPYPTFAYIARRGSEQDGPTITFTTRHMETMAAGSSVPIASTTYAALRAYKQGSTRETLAALKHILLTANAGSIIVQDGEARDGDEGLTTIDIAAQQTASLPAVSPTSDVAIA